MPQRRKATSRDVKDFASFKMLSDGVSEQELLKKIDEPTEGEEVEYEESLFSDPGRDYAALFVGGKQVGFWPS